jgi:hypothetical protein
MLHGMQKVRGSNPLSSTDLPDVRSIAKCQAKCLSALGFLIAFAWVLLVVGPVARGSTEPLAASASKG